MIAKQIESSGWRLTRGEVLETLRRQPPDTFHGALCDPPYGLRIFGSRWDEAVPAAEVWAELCRVLVPGSWVAAFGSPRTHHRLMLAMEQGGLEVRDVAAWLFGTGFPKGSSTLKPAWQPIVLARRPGAVRPLAIEDCRTRGAVLPHDRRTAPRGRRTFWGTEGSERCGERHHPAGRWPANVLLGHTAECSAEGCAESCPVTLLGGREGPARFFYCPKPAGREARGNPHPTKKPLRLAHYMAALIRWPGAQRLLVPFCGSGSELVGALRAGWEHVWGIERLARWIRVAESRLAEHAAALEEEP